MIALMLLVGCDSKYNTHITAGTYVTSNDESYILGDSLNIEKITVTIASIDEDTYNVSQHINVIQDMSYDTANRKYFSFEIRIKEAELEELLCEVLYKPSTGGHAPNTYHMTLTYPKEEGVNIDIQLTLSDEGKLEFYISLAVENNHVRALLKLK